MVALVTPIKDQRLSTDTDIKDVILSRDIHTGKFHHSPPPLLAVASNFTIKASDHNLLYL